MYSAAHSVFCVKRYSHSCDVGLEWLTDNAAFCWRALVVDFCLQNITCGNDSRAVLKKEEVLINAGIVLSSSLHKLHLEKRSDEAYISCYVTAITSVWIKRPLLMALF